MGEKQGCGIFLPQMQWEDADQGVTEVQGEGQSSKKNEEKELFLIFTIENISQGMQFNLELRNNWA